MPYYQEREHAKKVARALFLFLIAVLQVSAQTARTRPAAKPSLAANAPGTQDPGIHLIGWMLKFTDEFDGSTLNYSKWSPHPPVGLGTGGTEIWIPEAIELSGGQAHIVARKTNTGFTSGFLTTLGTFAQTYGRFEIRFRVPHGRGLEPLFQLLPVPNGDVPSVDVMNATGSDPGKTLFANRWVEARIDRDYSGSSPVTDLSTGFHIVAIEWDEEKIVWTVDGVERFQSFDGIPHQPLYLAVSLAVGTAKAGEPDEQTKFPAILDIDYIRVFARP